MYRSAYGEETVTILKQPLVKTDTIVNGRRLYKYPEGMAAGWKAEYEKMVYICSPLRGDIEGNLRRAAAYSRAAVESGAIPMTPHLFYASFLNDTKRADRIVGMAMGNEMLKRCDELWVFGKPTEGMAAEITEAERLQIPIINVPEDTVRELNERSNSNG